VRALIATDGEPVQRTRVRKESRVLFFPFFFAFLFTVPVTRSHRALMADGTALRKSIIEVGNYLRFVSR